MLRRCTRLKRCNSSRLVKIKGEGTEKVYAPQNASLGF